METLAQIRSLHLTLATPPERGLKLAAIDIGSNSVHMIIAATAAGHAFEVIDRVKEMVFLGRSVSEHGRLTGEAMAAGIEALSKFKKLAHRHGVDETLAVATAAVREAENGGEFLYAVAEATGIRARVISGSEEANTIYLAVRNAIDLSNKRCLDFDIGGGSVEAILGDAREQRLGRSLKLGVQRLRTAFGGGAPITKRDRRTLEAHVRGLAAPAISEARALGFDFVVGTSGTILALGQAALGMRATDGRSQPLTGQVVQREALESLSETLLALTPAERGARFGIDGKRADSIHVGGVLLCTLLDMCRAESITLCEASLREGVVLDYLSRAQDDIRAYEVVSDIRRHSVLELARRCGQSGPHPTRVARLSLQLFDQTTRLHRLADPERRLLEYAAILHDVGQHIGYEQHEHHAAYIIKNGELRGFTDLEREVIALTARYHRKARPKRRDADFAALPARQRRAVRVLSGILRLADGLDRSHHQLVDGVRCEKHAGGLRIQVLTNGDDTELEVWGARRKSRLLERVLGTKLELCVDARRNTKLASA